MIRPRLLSRVWIAALLLPLLCSPAAAQASRTEYDGAAALGLALRRLGTTKRVLMIGAHPDDEATQVLSTLALGQGADVAYLSLTRGEGGQNGIGAELQEGLGLLRTEELLAARRLDGAQQFFTRAIDYGFSKNSAEAFTKWPHDELLGDVVAVVRYFRPDVIVAVFTGTPLDGHGQHQAAGILAPEAFEAAADPNRYPEQIAAGLEPFAATSLYQVFRGQGGAPDVVISTGDIDPLLGLSPYQVAMESRSRHRSQDMGRALTPGPQETGLLLVSSRAGADAEGGLFAGADTTLWEHVDADAPSADQFRSLFTAYEATIDDARRNFNPLAPDRIVPFLTNAAQMLEQAAAGAETLGEQGEDLRFQIETEHQQIERAVLLASRIELDAIASDEAVVPGETFQLDLQLWNGGDAAVDVSALEPHLPAGWTAKPRTAVPGQIEPGALAERIFDVTVPADAGITEPYFLTLPRDDARYEWPDESGPVGFPFQPDAVAATASLTVRGARIDQSIPATFQVVDTRSGEFRRPVRVVPAVSVTVDPKLSVLPIARSGEPLPLEVTLAAEQPGGIQGVLRITGPDGWNVEPAEVPIEFDDAGERQVLEFNITPPASLASGRVTLTATFEDQAGHDFDTGYALVDYPHIRPRPIYSDAALAVQAVDVTVPAGLQVAYVAANGDKVPEALAQLGVAVDLLDSDQLAAAPLDPYDVIVIGSRAYEGRPDLVTYNQRLLDYVRDGGTMIVQYNQYEYTAPGIAPYPVTMDRPHDRVTDENAEVTVLDPSNPIFTTPNRITERDWEGWVQERGLYFLDTWDDHYTPLLEMADPGEDPQRGILMITHYGEGTYVYTGLALFRQFPAGVPGAYRLMANLLALGAK